MKIGFTNKLCLILTILLIVDTVLSFILSAYSIHEQYMGALPFFTACITPVNAGVAFVLNTSVNKSKAENTGPNNEGINYLKFMQNGETI